MCIHCNINLVPVNVRSPEENLQINPSQYVGTAVCSSGFVAEQSCTFCIRYRRNFLYFLRIDTYNILITYFLCTYIIISIGIFLNLPGLELITGFRPTHARRRKRFIHRNAFCDLISASNRKLKK